jgi:glutaredoxin
MRNNGVIVRGTIMRSFIRAALAASLLLVGADVAAGTFYKSVAPDGSIVYTDHPPADGSGEAVVTQEFESLPSSPVPDLPPSNAHAKAQAKPPPRPAGNGGLVMYSATWCGYCRSAKIYLGLRGIAFENIDIDTPSGKAAFAAQGKGGIPLLVSGSRRVRGFSDAGYDRFFAKK